MKSMNFYVTWSEDDVQSVAMSQAMDKKRKYSDSYDNISVRSGSTLKYQGIIVIYNL